MAGEVQSLSQILPVCLRLGKLVDFFLWPSQVPPNLFRPFPAELGIFESIETKISLGNLGRNGQKKLEVFTVLIVHLKSNCHSKDTVA